MDPRRLALVLLLGAAACDRAPRVPFGACPRDEIRDPVDFAVLVSSVPTTIRRDLGLAEIARLSAGGGEGGRIQGLTIVKHQLYFKTGVAVARRLLRPPCAWIDHLTVDLTPTQVVIYVPREYEPSSCEAVEILRHESEHEEIHRRLLGEAARGVRAAIAKADWLPTRANQIAVADRPDAEARFEKDVEKVVDPVYADFQAELAREQAAIDTPENYERVARLCSHWK
jgi:hypothetical protein